MRFHGYIIAPVEGKRIGKGPVRVERRGYYLETYDRLELAKQAIMRVIKKYGRA